MFNISQLKIVKGESRDSSSYSFVGIKRDSKTNELEFWLPLNFHNFPENNSEEIQKFFFKLYKTLKVFTKTQKQSIYNSKNDRDGLLKASGGLKIVYQNSEEIICYGKIAMLESIIDACDEMAIASIIRKNINNGDVKFDKINKYFDKAIYSHDDSFYIEHMQSERNLITINSTSVIELFCFIYTEIKKELLEENEISMEVKYLAQKFKETHLTSTSSIFGESFDHTIAILKQVFDDIHRMTSYKDNDFWLFFDAIEKFLYGEYFPNEDNGEYWGVNNFWAIWEDMCQTYSFAHEREYIAYADSQKHAEMYEKINKDYSDSIGYGRKIYLNPQLLNENIFYLEYQGKKRYIRPDCILFIKEDVNEKSYDDLIDKLIRITHLPSKNKKNNGNIRVEVKLDHNDLKHIYSELIKQLNRFTSRPKSGNLVIFDQFSGRDYFQARKNTIKNLTLNKHKEAFSKKIIKILDYKYQSILKLNVPNQKTSIDIKKQYIYELALKAWEYETDVHYLHEFVIPFFDKENRELRIELEQPKVLKDSKINLVGFNFSIIQDFYIKHEIR